MRSHARVAELVFTTVVVACLAFWFGTQEEQKPVPPPPEHQYQQFSIRGIRLDVTRQEVRRLWGEPRFCFDSAEVYPWGGVRYEDDVVVRVAGDRLEFGHEKVLDRNIGRENVARLFGPPDARGCAWSLVCGGNYEGGCAGSLMCEGEYEGWRYGSLGLTFTFSHTTGPQVELCRTYEFMDEEGHWGDWAFPEYSAVRWSATR